MVATNAELSPSYIRQLISLKKKPIREIFIWDREALSQRINAQPWLKYQFFGNPQFPLFVPASDYFPELEPDLLKETLGRSSEIERTLNQTLEDHSKVVVLHGPGGFGKSHFLREVGRMVVSADTPWQPWFVRPGFRDPKTAIQDEIVSGRKYIFFLDNAEKHPDVLESLTAYVKSYSKTCRLVIGVRSAGLNVVNEILKRYNFYPTPSIELPELTQEQQIKLLLNSGDGRPIEHPERIVKALSGIPYLIVNAGRQITKNQMDAAAMNDIRKRLAEDFIDECTLAVSNLATANETRDLIIELSTIIPLNKKDEKAMATIASVLKIDRAKLGCMLARLEERKLLRVIGNAFRFRADMLGDLCLYDRTTSLDANDFVRRSLERWLETKPEKVITNLAAASGGDGEAAPRKIIQELVRQWTEDSNRTHIYEQQSRLKVLSPAFYLAPDHILDLISAYANSSPTLPEELNQLLDRAVPLNMDDYGPLLVIIGELPGYAARVAPVALNLISKNLGGTYDNYRPTGLFSSLVDPLKHSSEDIKEVVDYLYEASLQEEASPYFATEAFLACAHELLAGSHEYTESYQDTLTFGQRVVRPIAPVLEYRNFTLERLLKLLHHPQTGTRKRVVETLQQHGSIHPSISRQVPLEERIAEERRLILASLANLLKTESDITVLSSIESLLINWWAMEREDEFIAGLLEIYDSRRSALYTAYRSYIAPDEVIEDFKAIKQKAPQKGKWNWWVDNGTKERQVEDFVPLARAILSTHPSPEKLVEFLDLLEHLIAPLNTWRDSPIIEAISILNRDFCKDLRNRGRTLAKGPGTVQGGNR